MPRPWPSGGKRAKGLRKLGTLLSGLLCVPLLAHAIPEGPAYPSPEWFAREARNFANVGEAPAEQASDPLFTARLARQSIIEGVSYMDRDLEDPSWVFPGDPVAAALLSTPLGPSGVERLLGEIQANPTGAVTTLPPIYGASCVPYVGPCVGDPFRYADARGADGSRFYDHEAIVTPVVFYDRLCARITGRVWRPRGTAPGTELPAVVVEGGGNSSSAMYWWAAQSLVRSGYVVMTFDPRGQGLSDSQTPSDVQGNTAVPTVYWTGLVDAIDFFRSTPATPDPNNESCAGTYPTAITPYNPAYAAVDPMRLGVAGHSHGAFGVSAVQGYGAPGADPWPGKIDAINPVKAMVAWDGLTLSDGTTDSGAQDGLSQSDPSSLTGPSSSAQKRSHSSEPFPNFAPRVPSMGIESEYGLYPRPYIGGPPDPEAHKGAFNGWKSASVPVFDLTIRGSSHYEFSLAPGFPTSSWCPRIVDGACAPGWGNPMAQHYTLAWFDRWLKKAGEVGYETADDRLLDDGGLQGAAKMSFYYRSARAFPDRDGVEHDCGDIRAGCPSP